MAVKSTTLKQNINQYVDTVGNTISLGFTSNLPNFIDSVVVTVVSAQGAVETGATLKSIDTAKQYSDTVWYTTAPFVSAGIKSINALAFIQENNKDSVKTTINIIDRTHPIVSQRIKPRLIVSDTATFAAGQLCSLSVSVWDTNPTQAHIFSVKQDTQSQFSVFAPPFIWTPLAGFTGTSTVTFKVADADSLSYFDTQTVVITILAVSPINHAPKWANKTINEVGSPGNAINLTISKMCTDPDGDLLTFSLVTGISPSTSTITTSGDSSIYSFTPGPGDTGTFYPRVVATDPLGLSDTMTITLKINAPNIVSKALTAFSFTSPAVIGTINESAKTVAMTVPYGTDVMALVATFVSTGASVKVGTTVQTSGTTANNFSSPVTYTVVATDGSMQAYTVTVTIAANSGKALTAFNFTTPAVTGTINESAKTVALTVPFGTDVTALVATFTVSSGASAKVGSTAQTSGTTANNFTSPVTYTVVAGDGSTQAYVVTVTVAANTAKALTAFSFTSPVATGAINETAKTVVLTVPFGTDVTALVATFASTGASVKVGPTAQTSAATANNFSSPVTYTVVAADGSTQAYVVTVIVAANTAKALTAFSFTSPVATGTINETAKTVALTVPFGTDVTALVATFASTGASVKVGSTAQISGTTANNFSSPVTYTVVANDGSTQAYVVTVTIAANTAKAMTAFSFTSPAATGTIMGTNIAVTVPFGTDVTALVATFTSTGASVKVGSAVQTSGTTTNSFSGPVTYTVVASDGSTQAYVVTVTVAANSGKSITAFSFASLSVTGTINESAKTISVAVPYNTDVTGLVATFSVSAGASVKVGSAVQTSGTTQNNFSNSVTYTVTAADGSSQSYAVTVTVTLNSAKAITSFSFAGLSPVATGTITGTNIAVTVPYATDVTTLVATFVTTGASVKVGTAVQVSGTTVNDFSKPVSYTIFAADGSAQSYTVTVTVAANTAKAITAFGFTSPAVTGTISGTNIAVTVPYGTTLTGLIATFSTSGASVKVGSAVQTSGITSNSFATPVTYIVVAADGSTQSYVVTVTIAANPAKAITAFSFASPAATGTITGTNIAVTVPYGTTVTGLIANFATTGASVTVNGMAQTSGTTPNNFSAPVTYTVVAADQSTQAYVVTLTIAANPAKAITAFSLTSPAATGTITGTNIAVTVPYGTTVTGLIANFTTTGASVTVNGVAQTSGTTPNNFSAPVTYTVVAADQSTQAYVVTVTIAANPAKAITAFSFTTPAATGTITGTNIAVTVPYGTAVTGLIANFTTTGASIKVNGVVQTSGTTSNNFSAPVTYTVIAADQSTQAYVVTVTIAAKPKYNLTVSVGSGGGGTVSPSGQVQVNQGDQTTIAATNSSGYAFVNWTVTSGSATITNSNNASTTVTLTSGDAAVTANFAKITYQLSVNAGTGGTITTPNSSPVTVNYGAATPIAAAPVSVWYTFVNWTLTPSTAGTITNATNALTATVTLTSATATVTANFVPVYQVSYNGNGSSTGVPPTDNNYYKAGASVSVLLGSNGLSRNGYVFVGWKGGPADTNTKTFTMPANNVTLNAQWDVRDADGNHYDTIVFNYGYTSQTWMVQNLKTTKYNDGSSIPHVNGSTDWSTLLTPAYCWYNDSIKYKNTYGALYNSYAVQTGKLAPIGWHVPTDGDFQALMNFLFSTPAYITNFAPYFGGMVSGGSFGDQGLSGYWWSSSTIISPPSAEELIIRGYSSQIQTIDDLWTDGLSVRCVRGDPTP